MKKKSVFLGLVPLISLLLLSACMGPQYKTDEKDELSSLGEKMMQEWLDEKLPGEKVLKADVYVDVMLGGPFRLTDYVEGTYTDGDSEYDYLINTQDKSVYSSKEAEEMADPAWDYMLEKLELDPETTERRSRDEGGYTDYWASLYLKTAVEGSKRNTSHEYFTRSLLPWDVAYGDGDPAERIRDFLYDKERNIDISVNADLKVPDEVQISAFVPAELMAMQESDGLYFNYLIIQNKEEELLHEGWRGAYTRYGWIDLGDFKVYADIDYLQDIADKKEDKGYRRTEVHLDKENFGLIEPLENGYRITYPEEWEHLPFFYIVAEPGSEIMKYDYEKAGYEDEEPSECHWKKRSDGAYELVNSDWVRLNFGYDTEITRRREWEEETPPEK